MRTALTALLLTTPALAAPVSYTVAPGNSLNLLTAESQTSVENFVARTSKVTGTLKFDATAKTGSGTVTVDGTSLATGNGLRDQHMRSGNWLNFDKYPAVKFVTTSVRHVSGEKYAVRGNFTLNNVTRSVDVTATVKLTPASAATKAAGLSGDVLAISTNFPIKLSDYGVKNNRIGGSVNNTLTISLKFVATDK